MKRFYIFYNGTVKSFWARNKKQAKCMCLIMFGKEALVSNLPLL